MSDRDELREVSAAVLAVTSRRSVREVLHTIVASARRLLDAEYAALGVPDDHGGFAEFVADGITDEQWAAIGPLPRQHGLLGRDAAATRTRCAWPTSGATRSSAGGRRRTR